MGSAGHVAGLGTMRNTRRIVVWKCERNEPDVGEVDSERRRKKGDA
jgi:hypothetical protein